ncbi:PREDICTED: E3 ubiquitin-protein ligase RNF168 [Nanorana parkeri]|uniref:E3 ubiquitin-protein ligase RNF168 n=1 Tax=Nanorana parkeri TaxID=125878 RepID=UPI000854C945|nr:PREDICTED: E3 ubiquitin-protein ligase RNF168 [Nanorana parkeri]
MSKKPTYPLPHLECLCVICREILLEPVTLPCHHTLCRPCFQMTVEKASLCCPFCRLRVSSWARYNARSGTLVNKELWEIIQRQYPEECRRRACGLDTGEEFEDGFTPYPAPQLCKPGEIRKEYEAEITKIEADRLRREEDERRASEEYIQKLLAEEEAEQRLSLERSQRELEEQMKKDEELAWMLNSDLDLDSAAPVVESPVIHKKTVGTKSSKTVKSNRTQSGDIERFLSPKSVNFGDTAGPSFVRNGELQSSFNRSPMEGSDAEPMEGSDAELQLPGLTKFSPTRSALQARSPTNKDFGQTGTHKPQITITTAEFSPPRCSSSLDHSSKWQSPQCLDMPEQWHTVTPKRTLDLFEDTEDHPSEKRPCLENGTAPGCHTEKLMELEETLHGKKMQEEEDRLLALKLQKLLDKEVKQVSRQKGSPDAYTLRPKRSAPQQEPLESTPLKRTASRDSTGKNSSEHGESSDENKKPASKKCIQFPPGGGRRTRKTSEQPSSPNGVKILKPSNKQQTILDMFQKSTRK